MLPDEPTDEERQEELPEDNQTPFNAAAPQRDESAEPDAPRQLQEDLPDTHPVTDTNIQREELYDEGVSGAAEAAEPNAGNAVSGYTPPDDTADDDDEDVENVAL